MTGSIDGAGRASGSAGRARLLALLAAILASGCGTPEPPEPEEDTAPPVQVAAVEPEPEPRRFLPDALQRSTRPETFPHGAHVQIDCAVCHGPVEGHTTHGDVSCSACHRSSAAATLAAVSPDDCLACHHSPDRAMACSDCHEPPAPMPTVQTLHLDVWESARPRSLAFDHGLHDALDCEACHTREPRPAAPACASCHEEHHTPTADCTSCHPEPRAGAHDAEVHAGCGGAGCHDESKLLGLRDTRPFCVSCHRAQEEHEPDGLCIDCHAIRGGSEGPAGRPPAGEPAPSSEQAGPG